MSERFTCPIQLESFPISQTYALSCGHRFSKESLAKYIPYGDYVKTCPICRRPIISHDWKSLGITIPRRTWNKKNQQDEMDDTAIYISVTLSLSVLFLLVTCMVVCLVQYQEYNNESEK